MTKKLVAAMATTVLVILAAPPAWAGPHEESVARFDEGRALVKSGRHADAIPKFIASLAAEPSAVAALNLADCYERVGKLASAQQRFKQAEALSTAGGDTLRASEARKRAEILGPRISTITLLPPPSGVTASAWIDGAPIRVEEWGKPMPFDAGPHEVILQTATGKRTTKVVALSEDGMKATVGFDEEATAAPASPKPDAETPAVAPPAPNETLRTAALVAGGIGIGSLVGGGVTGFLALDARSDLEALCATYPRCPTSQQAELEDIQSRGQTMATVSSITLIAGAALVATGVVLWIFSSPSATERRAARAPFGSFTF